MASSGMLRHVALVKTDVSEELSTSIIRVTRMGKLGTTLAVTSNRQEPHGVTSRKTPFFITSCLQRHCSSIGRVKLMKIIRAVRCCLCINILHQPFIEDHMELSTDALITRYPSKLFFHQKHHALVIWTRQINEQ
jgi:hypothetical protein